MKTSWWKMLLECMSLHQKESLVHWEEPSSSVWSWHVLPLCTWVYSGLSSFLPQLSRGIDWSDIMTDHRCDYECGRCQYVNYSGCILPSLTARIAFSWPFDPENDLVREAEAKKNDCVSWSVHNINIHLFSIFTWGQLKTPCLSFKWYCRPNEARFILFVK